MGLSIDAAFTGNRGHFTLFLIPMLLPIPDTRATWAVYGALLALVALLFFTGLADLPLDTHDGDYFRDSADARGRPVASGVYLFRLTTPTTTHTNKALLLK